jgi:flagellar biosynthesis protein FlhG
MSTTGTAGVASRPRQPSGDDQAAGLRRLFAPPAVRLVPVLADGAASGHSRWLAQFGEAFARAGQPTVLVDAARAQIAAALGLRVRFDLLHVLAGHCAVAEVELDAAPGLTVVPAARACQRAVADRRPLSALLAPLLRPPVQIALLLLPPAAAALLPAGDVLVPVLARRESVAAAVAAIGMATRRQATLAFRLLFLGMDRGAAATLGERMARSIGVRSGAVLAPGAVAPVPRDLPQVVAAAGDFALPELAVPAGSGGSTR